jgi:hypothetical protein
MFQLDPLGFVDLIPKSLKQKALDTQHNNEFVKGTNFRKNHLFPGLDDGTCYSVYDVGLAASWLA